METVKINFDSLTAEQIGRLFPIRIVPYNPDWNRLFEQEKELITEVFGENVVLSIEHIGSTHMSDFLYVSQLVLSLPLKCFY